MTEFSSVFGGRISNFLDYRTARGFKRETHLRYLIKFDRWCMQAHPEQALLSRELAETLSFAELCDFFGSFADERIAPSGLCEPTAYDNSTAEKIIVGAIKTDANGLVRAEKFVFTIENGVVTDVEGED